MLRPRDYERSTELIVTCAPHLWLDQETQVRVVDVSTLVGASSAWLGHQSSGEFNSLCEYQVFQQLLAAGWSEQHLRQQYRTGEKSQHALDLAIVDANDNVLVAVEVSERGWDHTRTQDMMLDHALRHSNTAIGMATDGRDYHARLHSGDLRHFSSAPSPTDLGLAHLTAQSPTPPNTPFQPRTTKSLQELVDTVSPSAVVLDFTLPWGDRHRGEAPLRNLLTGVAAESHHIRECLHVLFAWASELSSVAVVTAIVPAVFLSSQSTAWLRSRCDDRWGLCCNLELPPGTFAPITSSLLILGGTQESAYFDTLGSIGELGASTESAWYRGLLSFLDGGEDLHGFQKRRSEVMGWTISANDPQADRIREQVRKLGEVVRLVEVCDVRMGLHVDTALITENEEQGSIQILEPSFCYPGNEGRNELRAARYVTTGNDIPEERQLRRGDLLLPRIATRGCKARAFDGDAPAVAHPNLFVLRPTGALSSRYLLEYINSSIAQRLLEAASSSAGIFRYSLSALRDLPVPKIDVDLTKPLGDLERLNADIERRMADLNGQRNTLFDSANTLELQTSLREIHRKTQLLATSLELTNSFQFQVSNFFPYPLAYCYRLLPSFLSFEARYREQLRAAENLLAFLGSLSICLLTSKDRQSLAADLRGFWQGGISPGHWATMLAKASNLLSGYGNNPLATEIVRLNPGSQKKGFGKDVTSLVQAKNDFKHDRGPKTSELLASKSNEVQEILDRCLQALSFLTNHPIRRVLKLDVERRSPGRVRLSCAKIIGDHPGFQQEEISWHEPLTTDDLYIQAAEREWISLYPFLHTMSCPICQTEEVYFIDRWNKGTASMKSFERGHTEDSIAIGADLDRIVMLT